MFVYTCFMLFHFVFFCAVCTTIIFKRLTMSNRNIFYYVCLLHLRRRCLVKRTGYCQIERLPIKYCLNSYTNKSNCVYWSRLLLCMPNLGTRKVSVRVEVLMNCGLAENIVCRTYSVRNVEDLAYSRILESTYICGTHNLGQHCFLA